MTSQGRSERLNERKLLAKGRQCRAPKATSTEDDVVCFCTILASRNCKNARLLSEGKSRTIHGVNLSRFQKEVMHRLEILLLALVLVVCSFSRAALAMNPEYLAQMPTIEQVREDVGGVTELQRIARRTVAYKQLGKIVKDLSKGGEFGDDMTSDERALMERYFAAFVATWAEGTARLAVDGKTGPGSMRHRINRAVLHYDNQAFRDRLAQTVLPHNQAVAYSAIHPGGASFSGFLVLLGLIGGTVGLLRLYMRLFPRRADDGNVVAVEHSAYVSGGFGHATSCAVTRRESLILQRALLFGVLVFPLVVVLVAIAVLGQHVGALQPIARVLDGGFDAVVLVVEAALL